MIDSKWFLFATNSAAVVIALFEGIPFSFSVFTGCAFFNCVSSCLIVSNILWVPFAIIAVINLFTFTGLANTLVRILLIKWERIFAVIRVALAGAKMVFCSGIVRTSHFELFPAAITHGIKVIRKCGTDFFSCFFTYCMPRLEAFDSFSQIYHLLEIISHFGRKFNIHDDPELLDASRCLSV